MTYRPPQWASGPPNTSVSAVLPASGNSNAAATGPNTAPTTYFFDAVMRLDHNQDLRITRHPVQNGASIVDHAYLEPARLVLEVGMSDAMDSYTPGQYTSAGAKSVSTYQTFLNLQALRVPLTVNTRLKQYQNMQLVNIRAADTNATKTALRMLLTFEQIIVGTVTSQPQSNRPDQSNSNQDGTVPTQAPPASLPSYANGAGQLSSEPNAVTP